MPQHMSEHMSAHMFRHKNKKTLISEHMSEHMYMSERKTERIINPTMGFTDSNHCRAQYCRTVIITNMSQVTNMWITNSRGLPTAIIAAPSTPASTQTLVSPRPEGKTLSSRPTYLFMTYTVTAYMVTAYIGMAYMVIIYMLTA